MTTWPTAPIINASFQSAADKTNTSGFWKREYNGDYVHWDTKMVARKKDGRFIIVNPYKKDNEIEKNIQYFLDRAREEALEPIRKLLTNVNANNITDDIIDAVKNLAEKK